jgi:hypothetical protein
MRRSLSEHRRGAPPRLRGMRGNKAAQGDLTAAQEILDRIYLNAVNRFHYLAPEVAPFIFKRKTADASGCIGSRTQLPARSTLSLRMTPLRRAVSSHGSFNASSHKETIK